MRYVESKLMKNWRYQELERSSGSTFLPLICPVPLVPRQPTHTECHCRSSLTRRDTKLAFYIHLDMHLDYEKSEGQLPRSTRSSSRPRPVKDLQPSHVDLQWLSDRRNKNTDTAADFFGHSSSSNRQFFMDVDSTYTK